MTTEKQREAIKEGITELIEGLKHLGEVKDKLDELASFAIPYIHLDNGLKEVADFFDSTCYQKNKGNYEEFSIVDGVKFLQLPDKKTESFEFEGIGEMKKE